MRVTKESSDPEALDSEGKCKDIKKVKLQDPNVLKVQQLELETKRLELMNLKY